MLRWRWSTICCSPLAPFWCSSEPCWSSYGGGPAVEASTGSSVKMCGSRWGRYTSGHMSTTLASSSVIIDVMLFQLFLAGSNIIQLDVFRFFRYVPYKLRWQSPGSVFGAQVLRDVGHCAGAAAEKSCSSLQVAGLSSRGGGAYGMALVRNAAILAVGWSAVQHPGACDHVAGRFWDLWCLHGVAFFCRLNHTGVNL